MERDFSNKIEAEQFLHSKLFPKKDIVIKKGKGAILIDENNNEYIDCVAGHAVVNIGHSHPKFIEVVKEQVEKLTMIPPSYPLETRCNFLTGYIGSLKEVFP